MRKKSSATPREDRSAGRRVHLIGKFKDEASARAVIERLRLAPPAGPLGKDKRATGRRWRDLVRNFGSRIGPSFVNDELAPNIT